MKWWDRSWNPLSGCEWCSRGCDNCLTLANLQKQGRSTEAAKSQKVLSRSLGNQLNYVVCSLGDMFYSGQSNENIDCVFHKMKEYPGNNYFIMTKYSEDMKDYFLETPESIASVDWSNLWLGVSVEDREHLCRIEDLLDTEIVCGENQNTSFHKFLCLEPLLEEISIDEYLAEDQIEWVVVGAEIGERRRPAQLEWVQKIVRECKAHDVPVFVEQLDMGNILVDDLRQFPPELQFREKPWFQEGQENEGYEGEPVLDDAGWIGYHPEKKEFLVQAPKYIYDFLYAECHEELSPDALCKPIGFAPDRGEDDLKMLIRTTREHAMKTYQCMLEGGFCERQARYILPSDVMVRFHWSPSRMPHFAEEALPVGMRAYLKLVEKVFQKDAGEKQPGAGVPRGSRMSKE